MATATEVRERPIVLDAEGVRAILDGRKTMLRVPVRLEDQNTYPYVADDGIKRHPLSAAVIMRDIPCHLGRVGDRLWVREGVLITTIIGTVDLFAIVRYLADDVVTTAVVPVAFERHLPKLMRPIRPPHMPRWLARVSLTITALRVERLQDITHEDALAEGCRGYGWNAGTPYIHGPHTDDGVLPVEHFEQRWNAKYAKRGYPFAPVNPWVWVVGFTANSQPEQEGDPAS